MTCSCSEFINVPSGWSILHAEWCELRNDIYLGDWPRQYGREVIPTSKSPDDKPITVLTIEPSSGRVWWSDGREILTTRELSWKRMASIPVLKPRNSKKTSALEDHYTELLGKMTAKNVSKAFKEARALVSEYGGEYPYYVHHTAAPSEQACPTCLMLVGHREGCNRGTVTWDASWVEQWREYRPRVDYDTWLKDYKMSEPMTSCLVCGNVYCWGGKRCKGSKALKVSELATSAEVHARHEATIPQGNVFTRWASRILVGLYAWWVWVEGRLGA